MPFTPPPWSFIQQKSLDPENLYVRTLIFSGTVRKGTTVAELPYLTHNDKENAELICKAVNMHEHLITELEKIKALAWEHYDPTHKKEASSAELALNLGMVAGIVSNLLDKAKE